MPNFQRPDFMKKGPSPPPSPPSLTHRSLPPSPPASPPGADTGGKNVTAVNPKERAAGTIGRAGRKTPFGGETRSVAGRSDRARAGTEHTPPSAAAPARR